MLNRKPSSQLPLVLWCDNRDRTRKIVLLMCGFSKLSYLYKQIANVGLSATEEVLIPFLLPQTH